MKFLPKSFLNRINAPAHPYAKNAVMYPALLKLSSSLQKHIPDWDLSHCEEVLADIKGVVLLVADFKPFEHTACTTATFTKHMLKTQSLETEVI